MSFCLCLLFSVCVILAFSVNVIVVFLALLLAYLCLVFLPLAYVFSYLVSVVILLYVGGVVFFGLFYLLLF